VPKQYVNALRFACTVFTPAKRSLCFPAQLSDKQLDYGLWISHVTAGCRECYSSRSAPAGAGYCRRPTIPRSPAFPRSTRSFQYLRVKSLRAEYKSAKRSSKSRKKCQRLSVFELWARIQDRQTDGRTDGRTGKTRIAAYLDGRTFAEKCSVLHISNYSVVSSTRIQDTEKLQHSFCKCFFFM